MDGGGASVRELLLFDLGGRPHALPSSDVVEVVRAVALTTLPTGPRVVAGVMNLRGRLVPVFDLRIRFEMPSPPLEPIEQFIVARAGERLVAIRADRAIRLVNIPASDIEEAAGIVSGTRYLSGIAKLPDGIALIQDLGAFLSEAEGATLDRAMSAAEAP
jgi:purine-binding chemotaxis protein CheW